MSFLGVVILSFGFRIFGQRRLMKRHAPEIFGATTLSAAFSLFSTAMAARAMGLAPGCLFCCLTHSAHHSGPGLSVITQDPRGDGQSSGMSRCFKYLPGCSPG